MEASSKLARPYAVAAFRQAVDEGQTTGWSDMLQSLAVIVSDPTMKGALASPKVDKARLGDLIIDVAGDRLSRTGQNFVRVLAQYGRLALLPEIRAQFEIERGRLEGRSRVRVTSAHNLSDKELKLIGKGMARRLGTEVDVEVEVDPSLIGGVIIRAGDLVIDGSVRGRLAGLAQAIG